MSRKHNRTPRSPFGLEPAQHQHALNKVTELEHALVEAMVAREFTARDVVEWLFPSTVIQKMEAAYGLLYYGYDEGEYDIKDVGRMTVNFAHLKMAAPAGNAMTDDQPPEAIKVALEDIRGVHMRFNMLRDLLEWFDKNATPGAIKYYFPCLAALIPSDVGVHVRESPFHKADGIRYKEPVGIAQHLPEIRSCAALVASALLLLKAEPNGTKPVVSVQVGKMYDWSQKFRLV